MSLPSPPAGDESSATARFRRPKSVSGSRLRFRDADPNDAEFILSLRLDETKNRFISAVSPDVAAQRRWLEGYVSDPGQVYFIIETLDGQPVGTVRLYDQQWSSFGWGSWILSEKAPLSSAVESTLMVYAFGFACGFDSAHFDVRKDNVKVWQYHERFGARRIREDDENYYFSIDRRAIEAAFEHYRTRLPDGIRIEF